mmetsp:Transcript_57299/g.121834  ORF Transcript_57299/g.121834 Transcript_57299/m.121834 type:complete len:316 (-) Transcript_57299:99-1046(-)
MAAIFWAAGALLLLLAHGQEADPRATAAAYSYSVEESVELAYLATASYCKNLAGWNCGVACKNTDVSDFASVEDNNTGVRAVVGRRSDSTCFLAFRGVSNLPDVQGDLLSMALVEKTGCSFWGEPCKVGQYFHNQYESVATHIKESLASFGCHEQQTDIVGHSVGGALANLAAWDLASEGYPLRRVYTFGAPRLGDGAFAQALGQLVTVMRVTHANDPVVAIPWVKDNFTHAGVEVYYAGVTSLGSKVCYGEDTSCSLGNADKFADNLFRCSYRDYKELCGHFQYMNDAKEGLMMSTSCDDERRLEVGDLDILLP